MKPGKPPKFAPGVKVANPITDAEQLDLTQQLWNIYPYDVKRQKGHPAPFPAKLPGRLIRMFTYGAVDDLIVLDPFIGSGTTCAVAKRMRRFIGIDIESRYVQLAQERVDVAVAGDVPILLVGRPSYPNKAELEALPAAVVRLDTERGKAKHHRKTYGRGGPYTDDLPLVERMETERNI